MDDIPRTFWYRALEIAPGAVSWLVLIMPVIAVFWYPRAVAIFIAIYIIWLFLKWIKASLFLIHSFFKTKKYEKIPWNHLLKFFSSSPPKPHAKLEKKTAERIELLKKEGLFKHCDEIHHVVIMPTYKEEKEILQSSIEALAQIDFPLEKIIFVLATEERDKERAQANADFLQKKFGHTFGQFHHFMHPVNLPNEIVGKGSNISYAGKHIAQLLKEQGVDFSNVLVTTLDADNQPHSTYFSNLTYHYLMEPERSKKSYQSVPFFHNNIWEVPFANRMIAIAGSFWQLSECGEPYHVRNSAAHAQSLDSLAAMDFWSKQTIIEDYHQYWRAYFHFCGDYEVVPIFVPVYQDALQNKTYFTSLVGQYKQLLRWSWAAAEIPYVLIKMRKMRGKLPFWKNLSTASYLCYSEILRATAPIIIILYKSIPTMLNPEFAQTLFAYNLGQILNVIFTVLLGGVIISLWISLFYLPMPKMRNGKFKFFFSFFQWLFLPLLTVVYGAIPALDAQTRLMRGDHLGFEVTEKIRKIN